MLKLDQAYVDEIIAHAHEDAPNECCGIIAGSGGEATKLYRAVNSEASPYRYNVDSKDLLRIYRDIDSNDWQVLAIYHSHTATEAYPSATDIRLAAWPDAFYLILSLEGAEAPVLRGFRIKEGEVSEVDVEVA